MFSKKDSTSLPDLSHATAEYAAQFIVQYIKNAIPNSSTKLSLSPEGYPQSGEIEVVIRSQQLQSFSPFQSAKKALESGCGNCHEMAYAGALILKQSGYKGEIAIGQYGINHQFLFIEDYIADPWAEVYCSRSAWKGKINAYGGSIKDGIMYGRIVPYDHIELQDEEPEMIEKVPNDVFTLCYKTKNP